jgi:prevent-host-death family protein
MSIEITATDAARNFADLLDAVERDREEFTIIRRGKVVARLTPLAKAQLRSLASRLSRQRPRAHAASEPSSTNRRTFGEAEEILRPAPAKEPLLRQLLGELEDLGCHISVPGGRHRDDYVNVTPGAGRGRIASVHAASGRVEFQNDSWGRVGGTQTGFVRLAAGNKAAHPTSAPRITTSTPSTPRG